MKQLRKLISMLLAWINAVWKPIGKFLRWTGNMIRKPITKFLSWRPVRKFLRRINDAWARYYRKREDYYRYKRLMAAKNTFETREEIRSFLNDPKTWKYIDPLFFWQKVGLVILLIIITLGLMIALGYGIYGLQLPDKETVHICVSGVVCIAFLIFGLHFIENKLYVAVYHHRLDRLKAKLASKPAV